MPPRAAVSARAPACPGRGGAWPALEDRVPPCTDGRALQIAVRSRTSRSRLWFERGRPQRQPFQRARRPAWCCPPPPPPPWLWPPHRHQAPDLKVPQLRAPPAPAPPHPARSRPARVGVHVDLDQHPVPARTAALRRPAGRGARRARPNRAVCDRRRRPRGRGAPCSSWSGPTSCRRGRRAPRAPSASPSLDAVLPEHRRGRRRPPPAVARRPRSWRRRSG